MLDLDIKKNKLRKKSYDRHISKFKVPKKNLGTFSVWMITYYENNEQDFVEGTYKQALIYACSNDSWNLKGGSINKISIKKLDNSYVL